MDIRKQAYRLEVQGVEVRLSSALDNAESSVRRIRDLVARGGDVSSGPGRRLSAEAAEVMEHLSALATLRRCRPLIGEEGAA